jgi:hypothetical protein
MRWRGRWAAGGPERASVEARFPAHACHPPVRVRCVPQPHDVTRHAPNQTKHSTTSNKCARASPNTPSPSCFHAGGVGGSHRGHASTAGQGLDAVRDRRLPACLPVCLSTFVLGFPAGHAIDINGVRKQRARLVWSLGGLGRVMQPCFLSMVGTGFSHGFTPKREHTVSKCVVERVSRPPR